MGPAGDLGPRASEWSGPGLPGAWSLPLRPLPCGPRLHCPLGSEAALDEQLASAGRSPSSVATGMMVCSFCDMKWSAARSHQRPQQRRREGHCYLKDVSWLWACPAGAEPFLRRRSGLWLLAAHPGSPCLSSSCLQTWKAEHQGCRAGGQDGAGCDQRAFSHVSPVYAETAWTEGGGEVPRVRGLLGRVIVVKESRAEGLWARQACPPLPPSQPSVRKADTTKQGQVTEYYPVTPPRCPPASHFLTTLK